MRKAARRGDTRASKALRSLDHSNTSPLYENPVSLYAQFATLQCQSRREGEDYDIVVDVTKGESGGESGGEPRASGHTTAYCHAYRSRTREQAAITDNKW